MAQNRDGASKDDIAAHILMSRRRLFTLIKNGTLPASGTLDEYRTAYIKWLRQAATGANLQGPKVTADGKYDLTIERAKLTRA